MQFLLYFQEVLSNNLVYMKSSLLYNLTIAKHPTLNHLIVRSVLCYINLLQSPHIIVEYDIASHDGTMSITEFIIN